MPFSESASPAKRLSMGDRTNSTQSISKMSPSGRTKTHRAHVPGRLHTRNPSYPKNLNKVTKASEEETVHPKPKKKSATPSTSPATTLVKRNSSTVSLPRTGSKVNVRRNTSNVSLKRNTSHTQIHKRPTTPLRKNHSQSSDLDQLGEQMQSRFLLDDDDDDDADEWTEESASQSPSVTRHSSSSKRTSGKNTPNEEARQEREQAPEQILRPLPRDASQVQIDHKHASPSTRRQHHSRPPDADALTTRLLNRNTSFKLQPQISSVSATGTPGTQTPSIGYDGQSEQLPDSSLPENGISRFINAPSSLSGSTSQLQAALQNSQRPRVRARSSSPRNSEQDNLRRTRSSGNLSSTHPTATLQTPDSQTSGRSPPSYTIEPAPRRRGNMTQLRMELWRGRDAVEPPHGPPQSILDRLPVGELPAEERRSRQWDKAEAEMNYLRRFRNPVLEAAKRHSSKLKKEGPREVTARSTQSGRDKASRESQLPSTSGERAERGRRSEQHPPSRAGPRSVHFEVGLDTGEEVGAEREHGDAVEDLLRSLWAGGEMEHAGED